MINRKANMADTDLRKRQGCLSFVRGFLMSMGGLFLFLIVCWVILLNVSRRYECVEMPNGFLIGRATIFSSLMGWDPDVAIKYPDGRVFLRGDRRMDFWDEDSLAGEYYETVEGHGDRYIYLNDLGLILKSEQPKLYQHHYRRKRVVHRSSAQTSGGHVFRTYLLLNRDRARRRNWCPTAFAWPHKAAWIWPSGVPY